jgi:hypothetical protein
MSLCFAAARFDSDSREAKKALDLSVPASARIQHKKARNHKKGSKQQLMAASAFLPDSMQANYTWFRHLQ